MTVGSAIQAIQVAADRELGEGMLTAQIAADGKRIELIDTTGGTGQIQIASIDGSGNGLKTLASRAHTTEPTPSVANV